MQAITVNDRAAGVGGLSLTDMPYPHAAQNDVIVRVHAAGFTPGDLDWPTTWSTAPAGAGRPSVPGHERSGVVAGLGYGNYGPDRRPAGVRTDRLDPQRIPGGVHRR